MPRPQFSLKTLLWLMVVVAVLLAFVPPCIKEYMEYVDDKRLNWAFSERLTPNDKPPTWWWPWPR